MSDPRRKRRYRNNLDFVEAGLCACWRNANELVAASKNLIDRGQHAPALSLSVLALEELGKMCAIDGLVFARSNDDKAQRFDKSLRGHDVKLAALQLLPLFISALLTLGAQVIRRILRHWLTRSSGTSLLRSILTSGMWRTRASRNH